MTSTRLRVSSMHLLGLAAILCCAGASAQMSSARMLRNAQPEERGSRLPSATSASDDILIGRLELVWGDAPPGSSQKHVFRTTLVGDDGVRHALDSDRSLIAADDLYSLYQRRVAVGVAPAATKTAAAAASRVTANSAVPNAVVRDAIVPDAILPDAIVAIEDLASPGPTGRVAKPARKGQITANAEAITGTTSWVTLMCKFSDQPTEQKPESFFQGQYGNAIGQLGHYWQEVSYGQINLSGSNAYGWATLPEPRSFYVTMDTTTNKEKADLGKLFEDCTAAHDANVNFAINGGVQGVNMMFNDNLDGFAWGGGRCATLDGINKCWSTTWNPPWSFGNLAPLSHEMGHAYGLPHANNSDTDSDPYDNVWDVMSDAWNNGVSNATYGTLPKHINIYSRNRLGWVAASRKLNLNLGKSATSVVLDRASLPGSTNLQMITLAYPGQTSRYYTIETRKRTGDYENRLPGDAVVIHEIDTSRKEPAWSVDADSPPANRSNNEGSMFKVGETWTSPDFAFQVKVLSATTNGFVLTVKPGPIRTLPAPSRRAAVKPAAAAPPAATLPLGSRQVRGFANPELRR